MLVLFSDIPRIPGLVGAIFRLSEARRNEILSQPTLAVENGESLGRVAPELAALPSSKRISTVAVCRI